MTEWIPSDASVDAIIATLPRHEIRRSRLIMWLKLAHTRFELGAASGDVPKLIDELRSLGRALKKADAVLTGITDKGFVDALLMDPRSTTTRQDLVRALSAHVLLLEYTGKAKAKKLNVPLPSGVRTSKREELLKIVCQFYLDCTDKMPPANRNEDLPFHKFCGAFFDAVGANRKGLVPKASRFVSAVRGAQKTD